MKLITEQTLKDPRIPTIITITRITLSKDLHYCHLFFSMIGNENKKKAACQGLNNASGYIQKIIGQKLVIKYTPKIQFRYDEKGDKALEVDNLLNKLSEQREKESLKVN